MTYSSIAYWSCGFLLLPIPENQLIFFFIEVFKAKKKKKKEPGRHGEGILFPFAATFQRPTNTDSNLTVKDFITKNFTEQLRKKSFVYTEWSAIWYYLF